MKKDVSEALGFVPQKEIVYNKLLPYADKLDEESNEILAQIKGNLARAVQVRELWPGVLFWTRKLSTKKELLSQDDLELPWRPLYELYERILYSKTEHLGLNWFPNSVEGVLKMLVKSCRPYFPVSSTQEMLEEWRPLLCPFDLTMQKGISYFELFLPTILHPEQHHQGFKLWFEELMELWVSVQNLPAWEGIFTRFLRSLNLPVGTSQVLVPRYLTNAYDIGHVVLWISSMLGGPSKQAQKQLSSLFKSITTFFHPSNNGRWLKATWLPAVPDSHRMTEQDITEFVESMMQPVLLAMFSKTGSLDAAQALQNLALMRPELVIPPVLERTYPAMETLTEPHQLTATLSCMIGVARSLVRGGRQFPEGPTHMLPLLMRALPGVDPNDFSKCMVALEKVFNFATANIFETHVAGRMVADMCRATAKGYSLACNLLHHVLRSTALTYPTEYCSVPGGFERPLQEYLPIKDWGRHGDLRNLQVQWHVPSAEEMEFVFYLLDLLLKPELLRLQRHARGEEDMSRLDKERRVRQREEERNRLERWGYEQVRGRGGYEQVRQREEGMGRLERWGYEQVRGRGGYEQVSGREKAISRKETERRV
ncbi:hypothetical protein JZ751_004278 [Albula glossodonta]|uniref:Proteasome activator Blm10 middle HEAT repeats region domain-containing protein n=1 Tax=Albula glossodonta TaxID=121402 RepID=A0A8T2MNF3_9TELE|nr:hypothetical protein JZ751_004278 [Albula glossodonta]